MSEETLFEPVVEVTEDSLKTLQELSVRFQTLEKEIEGMEEALKKKKKDLEEVSRNSIPSLLNSYGLSEIRLSTGEKVEIQDKLKASVTNSNYLLAYRNMLELEKELVKDPEKAEEIVQDLFKSEIIVEESKDDYVDKLYDFLIEKEIPYSSKRSIHSQTLKKYCRGLLDQGLSIPEGISVFQYQETKIK